MGLAILPSRLVEDMDAVAKALISDLDMNENPKTEAHKEWAEIVKNNHPEINENNVNEILKQEIGKTFVTVLEHAGVYKRNQSGMDAFDRFMNQI